MKKKVSKPAIILFFGTIVILSFLSFKIKGEKGTFRSMDVGQASVEEVLGNLGEDQPIHYMANYDAEKAKIGKDLILHGRTKVDGKYSKRISKYFVCTDCHNLKREFKDISSESASDRLEYANANGIAYLPGSTFWGIYNRSSFYNDDYKKKYGSLVDNSRDSLENAIQLCSKYCSSGRYIEDWELESIMHYYKKNELRIKDLSLSENNLKNLQRYSLLKVEEKRELVELIRNSYRQSYSATFLPTMEKDKRKYGEGGDAALGEKIYEKSCLHCHAKKRVTNLSLDKGVLSARMFWRNMKNYSDKSIYQIIRYGTYSKTGRKQYMPLYTEEKMSDEQINDLVAYIKLIAKK